MKRLILAAGLFVALGAGPVAAREAPLEARAVPVSYSDLDLTRAEGSQALVSRLRAASARACSVGEVHRPSPATRRAIAACREQALATAMAQLEGRVLPRTVADRR